MKKTVKLFFLTATVLMCFFFYGCKKETAQDQENELLSDFNKIVPTELLSSITAELDRRKNLPNYTIYIDSIKTATEKLIDMLSKNNKIDEFKDQLRKIYFELNSSSLKSGSSIECQLRSLGLGYGIGADLSYVSSIEAGLYIVVGYELQRGGGVKVVYDFVNLERQIFYFSVCAHEGNDVFQGALGAGLSSGLGFTGFYEAIMGFKCQSQGIKEYAGPSNHNNYTVSFDIMAFYGASFDLISGGYWNNVDEICTWDECLLLECPDYFSSDYSNIKGITISAGGYASAGFALMVAIKESKIGICSEVIDGTYVNYGKESFGRLFAATLMSTEMAISGQIAPAALSYFYGLFDPCLCPNSAPNKPFNPSPSSGAVEQDIFLTLHWDCTDPDGDPLTFHVYSGPNGKLEYQGTTDQKSFALTNLEGGTNYTWQIIAEDDKHEMTNGPFWYFRTSGEPNHAPTLPYDPFPLDGASGISTQVTLSWSCYDPDNDPLRYHIYFGTDTNPPLIQSNVTQINYSLNPLLTGTKYYWKIIAEDDHNHFTPGPVWSFTTSNATGGEACPGIPTVTFGGKLYNTVQIGTQCWLKENLNYQTGNSWCYNNLPANCDQYGRLYDYNTALTACPSGWHLPSDDEWKEMEVYLGMSQVEVDLTGWRGTDQGTQLQVGGSSGFEAFMGGTFNLGFFNDLGTSGYWWAATQATSTNSWARILNISNSKVSRYQSLKENGFSVRCLKDN